MSRQAVEHIVILSDRSCSTGGAELVALGSALEFANTGFQVTFISGDDGADCPLSHPNIEVVPLRLEGAMAKGNSGAMRGFFNRESLEFLSTFISTRDGPGVVYHLHNWTKYFSPSIFLALRAVKDRVFMSAHDFALACPNLSYSNYRRRGEVCPLKPLSFSCLSTNCDKQNYAHKLWRAARSLELRFFMKIGDGAPKICVIHPDMVEYFTRAGIPAKNVCVVRNPVVPFTERRVEAEANADLFFIGRLAHEKGADLAAEAARRAGRRLRIIGDGELRAELEARYPDAVFEGWRTHAEIGRLIVEARALIVSSRLPETFTLVAHEAMRSGVPVVAFSDVDCREAGAIGAAIAVPPREIAALVAGIARLDCDETARTISETAFAQAEQFSNSQSSWSRKVLDHYRRLVNSEGGA